MNRQQELEAADREIRDLSTKIEGIKFHIRSLENSIALLNSVRTQSEQSIDLLKSGLVITSLHEFQKIKEDLQTSRSKIYAMRIDFNNHNIALERAEKFMIELKEKYVILLKNQDGRVVKGNFGGKK